MTRAGVVHCDPGCRPQPGAQNVAGLRQEVVLFVDQQAHDLPLGNADADRLQLHNHSFQLGTRQTRQLAGR
jgi:hypothetical protein